ncbi:PLP-dependent cysteine synthase family protein [Psychrobium sp. 1_MG-2023]|uniref:PLP-dependent cysteine synthase family protein n=1 Tax=Psychrobium sp. 1_MG-2023 TaxID=3062624 RepID=UPI000C342B8B|nr:PLP-dependent cysteine synthase family protein [Psychrobium sp. 1_MG-2023]MDP2562472.1 PLP-dependent cysteine synthase family protein [Psychrobium sp. 1_MG-2023]PKF54306.1 cysteine synthase [Alteromonadales bacterium alter-6D02]
MVKPRAWINQAIAKIEADYQRSADTHLLKVEVPQFPSIQLYFKDESTHPTGSLKHRLARSLFLYGLCNGWIKENTTIIEASSGSTAVSEAYFARLLGLPFIAVMPANTSQQKIDLIKFYGGQCHLVEDPSALYQASRQLAKQTNGHFIDQFTYAERATDWRGNNNIAESIFNQLAKEPHPQPHWVVMGSGTGGTSATIGRYIRYNQLNTRLHVVDPENSVFYDYYHSRDNNLTNKQGSRIEGIGRPKVEASFIPDVIDSMQKVPDAASIASMLFLEKLLGRQIGGSTGTNFYGVLSLMKQLVAENKSGSMVTLICDDGSRYLDTYYNPQWREKQKLTISSYSKQIEDFWYKGHWCEL